MTVSSGNRGEGREGRRQPAVAGPAAFERKAERGRAFLGPLVERRVVCLREIDDASVVPEDVADQLRIAVEPERPADERVEVPDEEVGEVERARLLLLERVPLGKARVDRVAVGACETRGAVPTADLVDPAGGAAIGVRDEHALVASARVLERLFERLRDPPRRGVQLGGEVTYVDVLPAVRLHDRTYLAGERPTGQDQEPVAHSGKASCSTNRSLKSGRSESSMYRTSSRIACAAWRS